MTLPRTPGGGLDQALLDEARTILRLAEKDGPTYAHWSALTERFAELCAAPPVEPARPEGEGALRPSLPFDLDMFDRLTKHEIEVHGARDVYGYARQLLKWARAMTDHEPDPNTPGFTRRDARIADAYFDARTAPPVEPAPGAIHVTRDDVMPLARWLWPDLHAVDGRTSTLAEKINAILEAKAAPPAGPEPSVCEFHADGVACVRAYHGDNKHQSSSGRRWDGHGWRWADEPAAAPSGRTDLEGEALQNFDWDMKQMQLLRNHSQRSCTRLGTRQTRAGGVVGERYDHKWYEDRKTADNCVLCGVHRKEWGANTDCPVRLRTALDAALDRAEAAEADLRNAVNAVCSCGGRGPGDDQCCLACWIWHKWKQAQRERALEPKRQGED